MPVTTGPRHFHPRRLPRCLAVMIAMAGALTFARPAWADCSGSSDSVNLGAVTSFAAASTAQGVSASSGFTCSGSGVLTLVTTNTVTATVQSASNSDGTQPRLHNAVTGDHIPYTICRDSSCASTYPVGNQITWSSTTLLGLLNLFSGPGGTLPIYIRTVPGTQLAAGTYTSTLTLAWNWNICSVGALFLCLTRDTGAGTSTVHISLTVERDCAITAPSVDFGSAALVGSFDPVTRTITIRCSKDAAYTVGISNGLHAQGNVRRLASGGNFIAYDIFFPASSNARWGNAGAERRSSSEATSNASVYTGLVGQTYVYRAEMTAGQQPAPVETYTDTLTVDVAF